MVSLMDLAPSTQTISVGGADVAVYGVSAQGIASLLSEFPTLQKMMTGDRANLDAKSIIQLAPDAIAAIIAAGCGSPGEKKAEENAARLPVGDQLALLDKIITLTMPQGFGPFVASLSAMLDRLGIEFDARGKDPDSKSESPSKDS